MLREQNLNNLKTLKNEQQSSQYSPREMWRQAASYVNIRTEKIF